MEKGLWIGLTYGHVFCACDMKKFFLEPCLFKDHLDFMAEGAGGDGQGVRGGGFMHELGHSGENDQIFLHRFEINTGFSLHQPFEGVRVSGPLVSGECCDKAAPIVVSQVVGVVVGLSQANADFSQRVTEADEMEWLGIRDHPIKVKNDR